LERKVVFRLGEVLIRNGWLTFDQLEEVLAIQKTTDRMVGDILLEKGYVKKKELYQALAIQYNMPFADFEKLTIPPEMPGYITKEEAYKYKIMPLVQQRGVLLLAISKPQDYTAEEQLARRYPHYILKVALALPEEIEKALRKYYGPP
jgi:type IV pilus assembly protein PilB